MIKEDFSRDKKYVGLEGIYVTTYLYMSHFKNGLISKTL